MIVYKLWKFPSSFHCYKWLRIIMSLRIHTQEEVRLLPSIPSLPPLRPRSWDRALAFLGAFQGPQGLMLVPHPPESCSSAHQGFISNTEPLVSSIIQSQGLLFSSFTTVRDPSVLSLVSLSASVAFLLKGYFTHYLQMVLHQASLWTYSFYKNCNFVFLESRA